MKAVARDGTRYVDRQEGCGWVTPVGIEVCMRRCLLITATALQGSLLISWQILFWGVVHKHAHAHAHTQDVLERWRPSNQLSYWPFHLNISPAFVVRLLLFFSSFQKQRRPHSFAGENFSNFLATSPARLIKTFPILSKFRSKYEKRGSSNNTLYLLRIIVTFKKSIIQ